MKRIIKNGRLIDPFHRHDGPADLLIEDGKVSRIGKSIPAQSAAGGEVIDASDCWVTPGFVDMHTHLREPGYEHKETIRTGTRAAAAGGFTSVCSMPNTNPVNDNEAVTRYILEQAAREGRARVFPVGAATKGSLGEELSEIGELIQRGCRAISDDGRPIWNAEVMRCALEYSRIFGIPVINHCEDLQLSAKGSMNEGPVSVELGLRGVPGIAEDIMVARDLLLARHTGGLLHLAHVSTAESVRLIREAKRRGIRVTAEACPHHFTLTDEAVRGFNTLAKVNPPLRSAEDVQAIRKGLADGTIDVIATDHAPHTEDEKNCEFDRAPFGMVGLETALPLTLALVEDGTLTIDQAVAKLTAIPSGILGLDKGRLGIGADADIAIIDPKNRWVVEAGRLHSKSKNTPFGGYKMTGRVVCTILGGRVVYREGEGFAE